MRTLVISELAGDADNAQLLGGNPGVFAKEAEFVANLDHQDGIHVLLLDVEELYFHGRQLASFGALLLGCCRRGRFVLVGIALPFVISIQAGALTGGALKPAPSERGEAVGVAKLLHKLAMQLLLLPLHRGVLANRIGPGHIEGRAVGMISVPLSPGRRARVCNGGLRGRV